MFQLLLEIARLSKEPRQNYSQVESLGCPGPTGEGGCEQTFLSHTPLQLWLTAMPKQELITDPGTQSILGMQLGVTACTPWIDRLAAGSQPRVLLKQHHALSHSCSSC